MRDYLPPGDIEEIIRGHCAYCKHYEFSNGWLAEYAKDIVERLK